MLVYQRVTNMTGRFQVWFNQRCDSSMQLLQHLETHGPFSPETNLQIVFQWFPKQCVHAEGFLHDLPPSQHHHHAPCPPALHSALSSSSSSSSTSSSSPSSSSASSSSTLSSCTSSSSTSTSTSTSSSSSSPFTITITITITIITIITIIIIIIINNNNNNNIVIHCPPTPPHCLGSLAGIVFWYFWMKYIDSTWLDFSFLCGFILRYRLSHPGGGDSGGELLGFGKAWQGIAHGFWYLQSETGWYESWWILKFWGIVR